MLNLIASLLLLINIDRSNAGISALGYCNDLQSFADFRAEAQVSWNELNHYVGDKLAISSLVSGKHLIIGENLVGWTGNATGELLEGALMTSPKHRANILEPKFNCVALGYSEDKSVISEVFAS